VANKKSALGKGLGALIPDSAVEEKEREKELNNDNVLEIDINKITPNEMQPRKTFDEEKLHQLSQSIKENGIIQPIIVTKEKDFYIIVAGERRWRAAKLAGLKKVPIISRTLSDKEIMELSLIENLQREDLNPIEEALAYKRLTEEFNLTQEEVSNKVGKSRPAITNSLRLLNLDKRIQNYLTEGTISEGHGRVLAGIEKNEVQYELAKKIIDEGLNVRQTEKLSKTFEASKKRVKNEISKNLYIKDIEDKFKTILGTKVTINDGKKKGKIEIEYYSEEDLQRIIDILDK
jgi:ParB family chromosome partitioning protein